MGKKENKATCGMGRDQLLIYEEDVQLTKTIWVGKSRQKKLGVMYQYW